MFCTAPRVSHRRSLSPLLAIFITLFLLDLSPLPTPSSLRPYSILDCALSPFVHALLNEGHTFRHVSAPTRLYIHLLLLYFYNYDDCSIRARIHGWEGVVSMGRVVACSFLFIASFRYKIASNYSVEFTGIYLRRVIWEYVSRILVDLWVVASWGGKIGRVWTIILVYFEIKFIFYALIFIVCYF